MSGMTDPASASGSGRAPIAARAEQLYELTDDAAAFRLVAPLFTGLRPADTEPDLALADAAVIHVLNHIDDHEQALDIGWATYARDTNRRLRGPSHPRTLRAAATLAQLLVYCARYAEAADTWAPLITSYDQLSMTPEADKARVQLAVCLHGLGRCGEAIRLAGRSWNSWAGLPGGDPDAGSEIACRYSLMLRLCHRIDEASVVEADARRLLPPHRRPGTLLFVLAGCDPLHPWLHDPVCARPKPAARGSRERFEALFAEAVRRADAAIAREWAGRRAPTGGHDADAGTSVPNGDERPPGGDGR